MKFAIKHRFSGAVMFEAEIEATEDMPLSIKIGLAAKWAIKNSADLSSADLRSADLSYADLSYADLRSADLRSADLSYTTGLAPERTTDLLMLRDQPGKIRAYKLINERGRGPFNGGLTYTIGEACEVEHADTDANEPCGAGINVATLPWCLREWRPGYRILIVEFEAVDIAAIPTATDGKFRLYRCQVIAEKTIDPIALGLIAAPAEEKTGA